MKSLQDTKIRCLRVYDYYSKGLLGGEDEQNRNFHLLCKSHLTSEGSGRKQGSFGLGKAVFWSHSEISTVIMSSSVPKKKNGKLETRIFGRSELTSHECKTNSWNSNNKWDPSGFFGEEKLFGNDRRAESYWGKDNTLADELFLNRDLNEQGTTVLTIAFINPKVEENQSSEEIIDSLEDHIKQWLWPGISSRASTPVFEVFLRHYENKVLKSSKSIDLSNWSQFEDACVNKVNAKKVNAAEDIAEKIINIDIPERIISPTHPKTKGQGKLRIIKKAKSNQSNPRENHVALLRRNICVVKYEPIEQFNHTEDPVFAVFLAGQALGKGNINDSTHDFLMEAEPPLHHHWKYFEKVKTSYKPGWRKSLQQIEPSIRAEAAKILLAKVDVKKEDFSHLSKYFNFQGSGGEPKPKARSCIIVSASINKNKWIIEADVNNLLDENKDWITDFKCAYTSESGASEDLSTKIIQVTNGASKNPSIQNRVEAPKSIDDFTVTIEASCSSLFTKAENELLPIDLTYIPVKN